MNRPKLNKAIQVALVEDDAGVRANLAALLNSSPGFSCQAAYPDAMTALKAIPANRPDVVLMDINMPGMPGTECVRRLKAVAPTLPVLMLTVYDDSEQIFKSLVAGATGYLLKRTPEVQSLTEREEQVLSLLAKGHTYKEISGLMNISFETVRTHVRSIYEKLHVHSRTEATLKYLGR